MDRFPVLGFHRLQNVSSSGAVLLCLCLVVGCEGDPEAGSHEVLARQTQDTTPSDYEPESPYQTLVPGLLERTRFRSPTLELRYLLIGPGQATEVASFEGAAVLLVVGGEGRLERLDADTTHALGPGSSLTLRPGERFRITNGQDTPLDIDATLFVLER